MYRQNSIDIVQCRITAVTLMCGQTLLTCNTPCYKLYQDIELSEPGYIYSDSMNHAQNLIQYNYTFSMLECCEATNM